MAKAKKTFFDVLYSATEATIAAIQKPGRIKMLNRAADRAKDELTKMKLDAELEESKLLEELAKNADEDAAIRIYKQLADKARTIEEAELMAEKVFAYRDKLFGPAPEIPEDNAE